MDFLTALILFVLSVALAPKPKKEEPPLLGDPDFPTAEPSRKVPALFGRARITGANIIDWGEVNVTSVTKRVRVGLKKKDVLIGQELRMYIDMALCHGPVDEIHQIDFEEQSVWSGERYAITAEAAWINKFNTTAWAPFSLRDKAESKRVPLGGIVTATSNDVLWISKPYAFGGVKNSGGVAGAVQVEMGGPGQQTSVYLDTIRNNQVSAYRGLCRLVFRNTYVGANTPTPKPISAWVKNYYNSTNWYPTKRFVGNDINPAHIIYEVCSNTVFGAGMTTAEFDEPSLMAMADTLFDEGFGLSALWTTESSAGLFIDDILRHVNGERGIDPATGKLTFSLARADYVLGNLFVIDESNVLSMEKHEINTTGETVNEVVVIYTDYAAGDRPLPMPVQNIASVSAQNATISETVEFLMIKERSLAAKVAQRELSIKTAQLHKFELIVNRTASSLRRGQAVNVSLPNEGIGGAAFRIMDVDHGELDQGDITLQLIQDIFGLPTATYTAPEGNLWTPQSRVPPAVTNQAGFEVPYWELSEQLDAGELTSLGAGSGLVQLVGVQPPGLASVFNVYVSDTDVTANYLIADDEDIGFTPYAESLNAITADPADQAVGYLGSAGVSGVEVGQYCYWDSEALVVLALDDVAQTLTLGRGVLDTLPQAHAALSTIYFADSGSYFDVTERQDAETVYYRFVTKTSQASLPLASAPTLSVTMASRAERPYPPGRIQINTSLYTLSFIDALALVWAHRDKTQQLDVISYDHLATSIGPEVGTTYTVRVYNEADALIKETIGITGTAFAYSLANEYTDDGKLNFSVRVVVLSVLAGLDSWQSFDRTFVRTITPLWFASTAVNMLLTGSNLVAQKDTPSSLSVVYSTVRVLAANSGYCEITINALAGNDIAIGLGSDPTLAAVQNVLQGGAITSTDGTPSGSGITFADTDIIGIAYNNGKVWFRHNGTWINGGDPDNDTGEQISGIAADQYIQFFAAADANQPQVTANFGGSAFAAAAPVEFASGWLSPP